MTTALGRAQSQAMRKLSGVPATSSTTSAPPWALWASTKSRSPSGPVTSTSGQCRRTKSRRAASASQTMTRPGPLSSRHSSVQSPVGPAPMMSAVSPGLTSEMSAAQ